MAPLLLLLLPLPMLLLLLPLPSLLLLLLLPSLLLLLALLLLLLQTRAPRVIVPLLPERLWHCPAPAQWRRLRQ